MKFSLESECTRESIGKAENRSKTRRRLIRMIPTRFLRNQGKDVKDKKNKKAEKGKTPMDRIEECDRAGQYELDFGHMKISTWPQETIILPNVHIIKAHGNLFTELPSFAMFRSLEYCDLSRCNLETVDDMDVSQLFNLKHLNLARNNLTKLPDDIGRLVALEVLLVDRNKLTTFPANMHSMRNCQRIDASHNMIVDVGTLLDRLPSLEDLNLAANPHLDVNKMGTRSRRLHDKRVMMADKKNRRAMISRALNVRREVLSREQEAIFTAVYEGPARGEPDELP